MPLISANLYKDYIDTSLECLPNSLCPIHGHSINFFKGTNCLLSNIGNVKLKIHHASEQGELEAMQQDLKEMETDEEVEIEQTEYKTTR